MSKRAQNRLINIAIVAVIAAMWWVVPVYVRPASEAGPQRIAQ